MKLFTAGPTEIEEEILKLGAVPQVYMRTSEFSERLKRIYKNLQYIFQTSNPVLMFASSGTGALDAAVSNFIAENDEVLVINGGSFGRRWIELCESVKAKITEVKVDFGKSVNPEKIAEFLNKNPACKAVFATLDETSSGALTDVESIGKIVKNNPTTLFIVDAVSGLLVEPFKMDEWGVDVAVTASQKALAIPPGLSFMAVGEKAVAKAETVSTRPYYFDVLKYLTDWKRGQTPFTPAVGLIFQLERRLEKICAEGLEHYQSRYRSLTEKLRTGMKENGFDLIAEHPANCISGYWTGTVDAEKLVSLMADKYGISLAPSGGELKTKMFRIGNFGDVTSADIDDLLKKMKAAVKEVEND